MSQRKQHESPCSTCPFARTCEIGATGGASVFKLAGQANGPFMFPCHSTHDSSKLEERLKAADPAANSQCAGAAIFRANVGVAGHMPDPLLTAMCR